jgi:hypothetical protein
MEDALMMYQELHKNKAFNLMHCWPSFQTFQKWKTIQESLKRIEDLENGANPTKKHETADLEGHPPLAVSKQATRQKKSKVVARAASSSSV